MKRTFTEEHRANLSKALQGNNSGPKTEEHKLKIKNSNIGKHSKGIPRTAEVRLKISLTKLANSKKNKENKQNENE